MIDAADIAAIAAAVEHGRRIMADRRAREASPGWRPFVDEPNRPEPKQPESDKS